ncbi:MAG: glycosyltransferase family 39 protein [Candidatus Aminicenantales bacterium]
MANNGTDSGRRKEWAVLLLILVLAAALRLPHIKADPPVLLANISGSAGIYFDEGIYCHNARNKILFGRWITDEWNPLVYNAPLTLLYYLVFRVFGISIVAVKLLNIFFGLAAILIFHAGIRRFLPFREASPVTALLAFDYCWTMYNRIGLLENFSALCFVSSLYFFLRIGDRKPMAFFLGMTVAVAALSKYLFAFFLISTLLAVGYKAWKRREPRILLLFGAGGAAVGIPWFLGIFLPFRSTFGKIGAGWGMLSLPRSLSQAWGNLVHNPLPRYLQLLPLAAFFLILFGGLILIKLLGSGEGRMRSADLFVFCWIAGTVCSLGLLNYRPLRYYLPLIPAVYASLALLIRDRERIAGHRGLFIIGTVLSAALFFPFFRGLVIRPSVFFAFPALLRFLIYAAAAGAAYALVSGRRAGKRALGGFAFAVAIIASLFLYDRHFFRNPTYDLEAASRFMETLPPGSIVMGQEAPRLTLGTSFPSLLAYENWFNDKDPFTRYKPTHLLVLNRFGDAEIGWIRRRFPEAAGKLQEIRRFRVWDTTMTLFLVRAPDTSEPEEAPGTRF